jgi:dihydropteroate synthase
VNKNTIFPKKNTLVCRGKILTPPYPVVMGILNITPDSFYSESRVSSLDQCVERAGIMLEQGAWMLDIGGASSRPGSPLIDENEEIDRVIPALEALRSAFPEAIISIDTWRSGVAAQCAEAGADIINDITAGLFDEHMVDTVAACSMPYIIMHMQGTPENMQKNPSYKNVVSEVLLFLSERLHAAKQAGISDIILDPGFGFGKDLNHNFQLLAGLERFSMAGHRVLAGISRKSMICKTLDLKASEALNGTTALHMACLMKGADILRVHDVKEAVQAVRLYQALSKQQG